ncbi:aspartate aminotransferase family protein [Solibacillus sp. FSL H8-0538]|uniref:aminotransferase family protein n=1 Tax=Solibacillus sp. FSL H8-0538 TaxID=2921400 RepID=UPI0030F6A948
MNNYSLEHLKALDQKHFLHPTSPVVTENGPEFIFERGEGVYLYDKSGRKLLDGMSSLWNVNIGHGRKEIAEVAAAQMEKLAYNSCFASFSNEPAILLAEKLAQLAPGDLTATFFTSGGSESNDTAYKLVRHYWILKGEPTRKKIITRTKSYHGVAGGSTSATGLKAFRDFAESNAPDFLYVDHFSTVALRELIEKEGPETIAAFVAEPIQGAGGVHIPPADYFKEVRTICDEFNIVMITDEVITGFGRTGKFFGMEHFGVAPDMMCFAKGVTSGYMQLGGVMISEKIHRELGELSQGVLLHGYTYSGHATACAVALKNIEIIEQENLVENSALRGEELLQGLKQIEGKYDFITKVKGLGLIAGLEMQHETLVAPLVLKEATKLGLISRAVVLEGQDIVVFSPPLCISKEEVQELISMIDQALAIVAQNIMAKA